MVVRFGPLSGVDISDPENVTIFNISEPAFCYVSYVKAIFTNGHIIHKAMQNGHVILKVTYSTNTGFIKNTKLALLRVMFWTEFLIPA